MELFAWNTCKRRVERPVPRRRAEYRGERLELGLILSFVSNISSLSNLICRVLIRFSYNMLKKRASGDDPNYRMSPGAYLLCSAQASSPFHSFVSL